MATTIVTKYGGDAPAASDIVRGELAVDTENGRLYTENAAGAVVELGSNPSGNITFGDNGKAIFGAGSDLQIYHDGSNSYIDETATGHLFIRSNGDGIYLRSSTDEEIAHFNVNGSVKAYYDNALKLATTATGIDVTGTVTADGLTVQTTGSTTAVLTLNNADGNGTLSQINLGYTADPDHGNIQYTGDMIFTASAAERLRITSAGNVGIGLTTGISSKLHVNTEMSIGADADNRAIVGYTPNRFYIGTRQSGTNYFDTVSVSGGNLLVGKTAAGFANTGHELRGGGSYAAFTRDGGSPVLVNRKSSDGTLVEYMKDGTTVGSIGSRGGVVSHIILDPRSGGAGLTAAGASLFPTNNAGAVSDSAIDLGYSVGGTNYRFKDLHLSGGTQSAGSSTFTGATPMSFNKAGSDTYIKTVLYDSQNNTANSVFSGLVLEMGRLTNSGTATPRTFTIADRGATNRWCFSQYGLSFNPTNGVASAAESLDSYEEGDYDVTITCGTSGTVSMNGSFNRAAYTKVGRLVTVHGFVLVDSVSSPVGFFQINLPFTPASLTDRAGDSTACLVLQNVVSANLADFVGTINEGDANIYVQLGDATAVQNDSAQQLAANTYIHFNATYSAA